MGKAIGSLGGALLGATTENPAGVAIGATVGGEIGGYIGEVIGVAIVNYVNSPQSPPDVGVPESPPDMGPSELGPPGLTPSQGDESGAPYSSNGSTDAGVPADASGPPEAEAAITENTPAL